MRLYGKGYTLTAVMYIGSMIQFPFLFDSLSDIGLFVVDSR